MRVALAYSGGLDTSAILAWLCEKGYDVYCYVADIGQKEDFELIRERALKLGAKEVFVEDLKDEFAKDFIFPMLKADPDYEGYLLGTAIARPLIALGQVRYAERVNADALCHGATGKGNDQVRFELAYSYLAPHMQIISPWRDEEFLKRFSGRQDLAKYLKSLGVEVGEKKTAYSVDENMYHTSWEGGEIEDIEKELPWNVLKRVVPPFKAKDEPEYVELEFEGGEVKKVNGRELSPKEVILKLNEIAGRNGIGIADVVETRINGLKSRGIYETPAGTLIVQAKKFLEGVCLDGELIRILREISPYYSTLIYRGLWFSPERKALQKFIDEINSHVNGKIKVKLYKGNVFPAGRWGRKYERELVSFEGIGDIVRWAEGFIRTLGLRFKVGR